MKGFWWHLHVGSSILWCHLLHPETSLKSSCVVLMPEVPVVPKVKVRVLQSFIGIVSILSTGARFYVMAPSVFPIVPCVPCVEIICKGLGIDCRACCRSGPLMNESRVHGQPSIGFPVSCFSLSWSLGSSIPWSPSLQRIPKTLWKVQDILET